MAADNDSEQNYDARVARTRERFEDIAEERDELSGGIRKIADGLSEVLGEFDPDAVTHQTRLDVLLRGLTSFADLLERDYEQSSSVSQTMEGASNLDQFRQTFRKEARKRLSGLSISMMGIFSDEESNQALEQTAEHLHALKGSASMIGLSVFAELVRAMERVVSSMSDVESEERVWPTGPLLRGFHLLESTVEDPTLEMDEDEVNAICQQLRRSVDSVTGPHETVPQERVDETEHIPETYGSSSAPGSGVFEKRILIVDDVETIAASVGFVLSELEVPIDVASNGEEAWEMLQDGAYSLVVSDISMPRLDGIALTRMIRKDDRLKDIPVVLLTSLDRPDERDAGMKAGASDYIIKGSIGGGELLERVRDLLELAPQVRAPTGARPNDQCHVLIVEDAETIAASIALVLSEGPYEIDIVNNGQKALNRLRSERYDVILSDVQMPEMGGFELLETVRNDDQLSEMPFILLTSLEDPETQERAREAGADRFLIKGKVGGDRLLGVVEEVANSR